MCSLNSRRDLFIITSCIYPCDQPLSYSSVRSIYSPEERLEQTKKTIQSIRDKCSNAYIVLCDNGIKCPTRIDGVNKFKYIGNKIKYRKAADSPNKSLGETLMILNCWRTVLFNRWNRIFKLSGRYWLNENFYRDKYDVDAFCFLHLTEIVKGNKSYVKGPHCTRLYSLPGKCKYIYLYSLFRSLRAMSNGESVEMAWPPRIKYQIHYMNRLGVSGNVGVDKDWKDE